MKEFKGTPTPWLINYNDETLVCGTVKPTHKGRFVAEKPLHLCTDEEWEYNKRLIAAAPDLLAFAIDFVEKVESGRARSTDSYNKAKLAINKALT